MGNQNIVETGEKTPHEEQRGHDHKWAGVALGHSSGIPHCDFLARRAYIRHCFGFSFSAPLRRWPCPRYCHTSSPTQKVSRHTVPPRKDGIKVPHRFSSTD